jgi:DNA-binding NtrC family response regulator
VDLDIKLSLGQTVDANQLVDKYKKKYILAALKATGGSITKASHMLSLKSPQALRVWMKNVGVSLPNEN